ncbi:MAG: hypothetical protein RSE41_06020, partial [Clostridia bacterium]
ELRERNFKVNYPFYMLVVKYEASIKQENYNNYQPTLDDINLNRQRLIERYNANPKAHRWTGHNKPEWLK